MRRQGGENFVQHSGPELHSNEYAYRNTSPWGVPWPAVSFALSSLALLVAASSQAQEQEQEGAQDEQTIEEITVTGSRIGRSGFTTAVPVTTMNTGELQDLEPGSTLSQQLDLLPQFLDTTTTQEGGGTLFGTAGQAHLDMRGVGRERTLVLLDGSRVVPSDRWSSVNVDYFPTALIERTEVVTGGASAAYGADALAGVTNFILDRDFTGVETRLRGGVNEYEGDGKNWSVDVAFGTPIGDRMHIIGSFEARRVDQIRRFNVPWDRDWDQVTNPGWDPDDPSTNPRLLTKPRVHTTSAFPTGRISAFGFSLNRYTFTADGSGVQPFRPGDYASTGFGPGVQRNQSGGPEYALARQSSDDGPSRNEVDQRTGFLGLDYDLTDDVTLWGHGIIGKIEANGTGAGTFLAIGPFAPRVFPENAFLPEDVRQAMINEGVDSFVLPLSGDLVPDQFHNVWDTNTHEMFSVTAGADVNLPGSWDLRASYQYGEADKETASWHRHRMDRIFLAMDSVRGENGEPMCRIQRVQQELAAQGRDLEQELHAWAQENTMVARHDAGRDPDGPSPIDFPISVDSIDNTIRDCVPLNAFGFENASPAAKRYIEDPYGKVGVSTVTQDFAEVLITGELYQGWGAGPISQAIGATYRDESIKQGVDDRTKPIDALGPPMNVTLDDGTVVTRGIAPGFAGGSPNLHFFSTVPTFSGGFDVWEVFSETIVPIYASASGNQRVEASVAARLSDYSRAGEVWSYKGGLNVQLTSDLRLRGTYSRDVREASFSEQFDQQGGGVFIDDPATDFTTQFTTVTSGGNPDVEPETADTTVVGFVYQPGWLSGLQLSADYYEIDISDAIGQLDEQRLVENCHFEGVNCDLVIRDAETGNLQRIFNIFLNIDKARVRGVDYEVSYRTEPDLFANQIESLSVRVLAGNLKENSEDLLGVPPSERAGSTVRPEWTATGFATYNIGAVGVSLTQRWVDNTKVDVDWVEGIDVDDNTNPSESYTNLGLTYTQDEGTLGTWSVSLNINNLFDRDPPEGPSAYAGIFDQLGRRYSVSFSHRY